MSDLIALEAIQDFTYDGKPLKVGARFIARSANDARLLVGFGRAKETEPIGSGHYSNRSMAKDTLRMPDKANRYRRTDMRAQDE